MAVTRAEKIHLPVALLDAMKIYADHKEVKVEDCIAEAMHNHINRNCGDIPEVNKLLIQYWQECFGNSN